MFPESQVYDSGLWADRVFKRKFGRKGAKHIYGVYQVTLVSTQEAMA